jgi:hypothetical protein
MYFYDAAGNQMTTTGKTIVVGDYSAEWVTTALNVIAPKDAVSADIMFTDPSYNDTPALFDNATITMSSGNAVKYPAIAASKLAPCHIT